MCYNYWAPVLQLLKPVRLQPVLSDKRSQPREAAHGPKLERSPTAAIRESPRKSKVRPSEPEINQFLKRKTMTNVGKVAEKWNPHTLLMVIRWHNNSNKSLWKVPWQFLKRLNTNLPHNPKILLLDIYPRDMPNHVYLQVNIHSTIFIYNSLKAETTQTSMKY